MTEAEIRADERQRCADRLEELARDYEKHWTPLIGADTAKAHAWNLLVASCVLLNTSGESR